MQMAMALKRRRWSLGTFRAAASYQELISEGSMLDQFHIEVLPHQNLFAHENSKRAKQAQVQASFLRSIAHDAIFLVWRSFQPQVVCREYFPLYERPSKILHLFCVFFFPNQARPVSRVGSFELHSVCRPGGVHTVGRPLPNYQIMESCTLGSNCTFWILIHKEMNSST